MESKQVPVFYDENPVSDIYSTISFWNGSWIVSSTELIRLYKVIAPLITGFSVIQKVVVRDNSLQLYSHP
jgi:hypothetical protein